VNLNFLGGLVFILCFLSLIIDQDAFVIRFYVEMVQNLRS